MSDDLVKRLRQPWDADRSIMSQTGRWMVERTEAADRIEELETKLATCKKYRDAYAECDKIATQAVRDLEAKLVKALEALSDLADCVDLGCFCSEMEQATVMDKARATAAELAGCKHE